jgi:hypothetical protein
MNNNNDMKNGAYKKLEQIIEKAIKSETESVTLEYADEGLEVCFICGNTGIGDVIVDPIMRNGILRLIVGMAKLDNKSKGMMVWTILGKQYKIAVEEYDNFGEPAFKLILNKAKPRKPKIKADSQGVPEVFLQGFDSGDEK